MKYEGYKHQPNGETFFDIITKSTIISLDH